MAAISAEKAGRLLDQVRALEHSIRSAGEAARSRLAGINLQGLRDSLPLKDDQLDADAWSQLSEAQRESLSESLVQVRDSLKRAVGLDGPVESGHLMNAAYASNGSIVAWTIAGFALVVALLVCVFLFWDQATKTDLASQKQLADQALAALNKAEETSNQAAAKRIQAQQRLESADPSQLQQLQQELGEATRQSASRGAAFEKARDAFIEASKDLLKSSGAKESTVLLMVILLGALGGALHWVSSLVMYIGNRQLKRSWLLYYFGMPFVGAALAPIFYMLVRVGLVNPAGPSSDGSSLANLNLIAIYSLAALTGLFAKTATQKLSEIFATLFRTSESSKDKMGKEVAPGKEKTES